MSKPNFFIVGMSKCGTTSLHNYVDLHKQIYMSKFKEPQYFIKDFLLFPHGGKGDRVEDDIVTELEKYESLFSDSNSYLIRGESSADYLYYEKSAELIKEYNPEAKIVIILRNPVDRAYSAYTHLARDGRETETFEYAIEKEEERIKNNYGCMWHLKNMGLYYQKVKHYLDVFDKEQVKIILFDDFKDNTEKVLNDLFSFLRVEVDNLSKDDFINYNVSGVPKNIYIMKILNNRLLREIGKKIIFNGEHREYIKGRVYKRTLVKNKIDEKTNELLKQYFEEDICKLEELIEVDLSIWK